MYKISKEQMVALVKVIEKWDEIRNGNGTELGRTSCPLCTLYNRGGSCKQCVVYLETGGRFCENSPFKVWSMHHVRQHPTLLSARYVACSECKELANDEYEFLVDLKSRCIVTRWQSIISPIFRIVDNECGW